LKGTPSPEFNFENHKGGTKLSDIKGKYVILTFKYSKCAPCRQEIPYLQKIEKKYEDKREFVSISIDQKSDYEKWKTLSQRNNLGCSVVCRQRLEFEFMIKYGVTSIPVYSFRSLMAIL
jgi:thiol-disulfide isomerase/thioredoxin